MNSTTKKKKTLLVLAAGMGSRYGGLKQIDPVGPGGETIIDYSVYDALRAGFDRLVFVIRRDIESAFRDTIGQRFEKRVEVKYVFQELDGLPPDVPPAFSRKKPWGTGHAILMANNVIQEPFGVINADDFYGRQSFQHLGANLNGDTPDYAMVGFSLRNTLSDFGTVSRGLCAVSNGLLDSVCEIIGIGKQGSQAGYKDAQGQNQSLTGDEIVSMNMWGFNPEIFTQLQSQFRDFLKTQGGNEKSEFYIPSVVNQIIQQGQKKIKVLPTESQWFGVTYREDRPHVIEGIQQLIRSGEYPERLWL